MDDATPPSAIRIDDKLDLVERHWTPHRIARFDDHQIVVARVRDEFVWHAHDDHDEVFLPLSGVLLIDFEDDVTRRVGPGEILVVPAGVRHRPRTESGEVTLLIIDPLDVRHTGTERTAQTVDEYPEI